MHLKGHLNLQSTKASRETLGSPLPLTNMPTYVIIGMRIMPTSWTEFERYYHCGRK